jgi:serine/threonine protein kinase
MAPSPTSSSTHPLSPTSQIVYVVPPAGRYIGSGFAADVYQTNEYYVIKRPKFFPEYHAENKSSRALLVDNERKIYERLGSHKGIIGFYGIPDESAGAIKLSYVNDGDLLDYITTTSKPSGARRAEMIRILSEAWLHIYSPNVSAQDIKTENILVQTGVPKVSDFTQGILFPIGADMHEVCPEDVLRVDLTGISCVIYSVAVWEVFDYDHFEEQRWPGAEDLKPTDNILCGEIIKNCWYGKYNCMKVLHDDVVRTLLELGY